MRRCALLAIALAACLAALPGGAQCQGDLFRSTWRLLPAQGPSPSPSPSSSPSPRASAPEEPGMVTCMGLDCPRIKPAGRAGAGPTTRETPLGLPPAVVCPPPGFDALGAEFNISSYISAPWYVQAQVPLVYQPKEQLYCVRAQYTPLNPRSPAAGGLRVRNYANEGRVNGPAVGTSGASGPMLTARVADPSRPAKLTVGFSLGFTGRQLSPGPYWVIAAGASPGSPAGAYDWAVVSGGPPAVAAKGGCRTGNPDQVNFSGLWLFSRKPIDPVNTDIMMTKLKEMGLDTTVLEPVTQQGCLYEGAEVM